MKHSLSLTGLLSVALCALFLSASVMVHRGAAQTGEEKTETSSGDQKSQENPVELVNLYAMGQGEGALLDSARLRARRNAADILHGVLPNVLEKQSRNAEFVYLEDLLREIERVSYRRLETVAEYMHDENGINKGYALVKTSVPAPLLIQEKVKNFENVFLEKPDSWKLDRETTVPLSTFREHTEKSTGEKQTYRVILFNKFM